jgi:hypothetical protein
MAQINPNEVDKVRKLSASEFARLLIAILGDDTTPGLKLLGKKSDDTFENIKSDDSGRLQVYDSVGVADLTVIKNLVTNSQGMIFYGVVTDAVPAANQFTIPTLAGKGDTAFVDWTAYVFWDAGGGGAAPQEEQQSVATYASATGTFTTAPFTAPVDVGDVILILHPRLRDISSILTAVTTIQTLVTNSQGLLYYGVVTDAVPAANQFTIPTLAGKGETAFVDWTAYVFWDAGGGGAAPQEEQQTVTAYVSATGIFTTAPFTAPVDVGDVILILHPRLRDISSILTAVNSIKTQTDKTPNFEMEVEWSTTPVSQQVASAAATNLTAGSITPAFPTGATVVRVLLYAAIHAANQGANTHHVSLKVQGRKDGGGYGDLIDLTAQTTLGLVNVDGASDSWCGAVDVSALVDASGSVYDFHFVVDSDNAGAVNYTTNFVLVLVYNI